ncbi:MAG: hypothetical protein KDA37_01740 [Planctomycetales bacterium]|nr:hypothetical protein [Planctomycetales bacterium]
MPFDPAAYGPVFPQLIPADRRRALDEGQPVANVRDALDSLSVSTAFSGRAVTDLAMAQACLAGVWLVSDYLDESHTLSQAIPTREGSFWHGIMHRREGDYSNAKYWFRRVGEHPVFEQLAAQFGEWDPYDFVDRCQQAVRSGSGAEGCLVRQQAEWERLFDWCYDHAVG